MSPFQYDPSFASSNPPFWVDPEPDAPRVAPAPFPSPFPGPGACPPDMLRDTSQYGCVSYERPSFSSDVDDGASWLTSPPSNQPASVSSVDLALSGLDMASALMPDDDAIAAETWLGSGLKLASAYGDLSSASQREAGDPRRGLEYSLGTFKALDGAAGAWGALDPRMAGVAEGAGVCLGVGQGLTETVLGAHNLRSSDEADQLTGTRQLMKGPASVVGALGGPGAKGLSSAWVLGVDLGSMMYDSANENRAANGEANIADHCADVGLAERDAYLAQIEDPSRRQLRRADRRGMAATAGCSMWETLSEQLPW